MNWIIGLIIFIGGATFGFIGMALLASMHDDIDPYADEFREGDS